MTAQEEGLLRVSNAVRRIVPPQLDFLVVIYRKEGEVSPRCISYSTSTTAGDLEKRATAAAGAFIVQAREHLGGSSQS